MEASLCDEKDTSVSELANESSFLLCMQEAQTLKKPSQSLKEKRSSK